MGLSGLANSDVLSPAVVIKLVDSEAESYARSAGSCPI